MMTTSIIKNYTILLRKQRETLINVDELLIFKYRKIRKAIG